MSTLDTMSKKDRQTAEAAIRTALQETLAPLDKILTAAGYPTTINGKVHSVIDRVTIALDSAPSMTTAPFGIKQQEDALDLSEIAAMLNDMKIDIVAADGSTYTLAQRVDLAVSKSISSAQRAVTDGHAATSATPKVLAGLNNNLDELRSTRKRLEDEHEKVMQRRDALCKQFDDIDAEIAETETALAKLME